MCIRKAELNSAPIGGSLPSLGIERQPSFVGDFAAVRAEEKHSGPRVLRPVHEPLVLQRRAAAAVAFPDHTAHLSGVIVVALRALEAVLDKKSLVRIEATPTVIDRLVDRFAQGSM